MKELLQKFEQKVPEIIFEWHDTETEAQGWIVINSLRGGAAGGGTRMRKGLDKREVESLAKTMEIKFAVAGPPIGGAKSGINFDPTDPRKKEVLQRWYKAVLPILKSYYGTGGDLNVDEIHDVIPITEKLGLLHPQEGVVNGHFGADAETKKLFVSHLQKGVTQALSDTRYSPDVKRGFTVADMITGYGVSESVKHYLSATGQNYQGKKVIVQGWGNVGAAAAYYATQEGAKVVAIIDREGGLIAEDGLDFKVIRSLFLSKKGNTLESPGLMSFQAIDKRVWDLNADIFFPCAASRLVTREQLERMHKAGISIIACGANVPFADPEIFYGATMEWADKHFALIPDFVANCGMARVFAYCMQSSPNFSDAGIFGDTSQIIGQAVHKAFSTNGPGPGFAAAAFTQALKQLV